MKTKNLKKKVAEIWQIGSFFSQNLAWVYAAVSEKPDLTDGRTTDDGRLCHDSSSADKVKRS